MIDELLPNQIFVFGSNRMGHHIGGAAKLAFDKFDAVWGMAEGLFGQSYAFPTLGYNMQQVTMQQLEASRDSLYACAIRNPDKEFLLTPVGTGIAGFSIEEVAPLFENMPTNVKKVGWS